MEFDVAKLPAYVYEDKDRKGRVRYRIRKPGMPSRTIKADPTSKAFRDAYNAYLDGSEPVTAPKNSFEWLVGEYLHNLQRMVKNGQAAPATYKQRRLQLGKISKDNGDRDAFALTPKAVRRIIGELAATPAVANNVLKSLRAMYKWAVESGMTDINPTMGVPSLRYKTDGFKAWTMADLRQFAHAHPIGTESYLCAILAICTGGRRGDIAVMGPKNLTTIDGVRCIRYRQQKGGKDVVVPVLPILQDALDAMPMVNATAFVPNSHGRPFNKVSLANWFSKRVKEAGMSGRSLHGLRKAQGVLLAEMGCTQYEIMAVQGHSDPKSSEIYTRSASRTKLAVSAMDKAANFKL